MLASVIIIAIILRSIFKKVKLIKRLLALSVMLLMVVLGCTLMFYQYKDSENPFLEVKKYTNVQCATSTITFGRDGGKKVMKKNQFTSVSKTSGNNYVVVIDKNILGKLLTVADFQPKYLLYLNNKDM